MSSPLDSILVTSHDDGIYLSVRGQETRAMTVRQVDTLIDTLAGAATRVDPTYRPARWTRAYESGRARGRVQALGQLAQEERRRGRRTAIAQHQRVQEVLNVLALEARQRWWWRPGIARWLQARAAAAGEAARLLESTSPDAGVNAGTELAGSAGDPCRHGADEAPDEAKPTRAPTRPAAPASDPTGA